MRGLTKDLRNYKHFCKSYHREHSTCKGCMYFSKRQCRIMDAMFYLSMVQPKSWDVDQFRKVIDDEQFT